MLLCNKENIFAHLHLPTYVSNCNECKKLDFVILHKEVQLCGHSTFGVMFFRSKITGEATSQRNVEKKIYEIQRILPKDLLPATKGFHYQRR
jgi:hypothetical protein